MSIKCDGSPVRWVNGLWIGAELPPLAELCIRSYQDHGFKFRLLTYGHVSHVPDGTEIFDASTLVPEDELFQHSTGSLAPAADRIRYSYLSRFGGLWTDMDMVCLKPFDFPGETVFGLEEPGLANLAVLKFPAAHPAMQLMAERMADPAALMPWDGDSERRVKEQWKLHNPDVKNRQRHAEWSLGGPAGFTETLRHLGILHLALGEESFNSVPYTCWRWNFDGTYRPEDERFENSFGIHLWGELLRREPDAFQNLHPESVVAQLMKKHGCWHRALSHPPHEIASVGKPRILVGICSCAAYPEKRQAVRDTWMSRTESNIECRFFIGVNGQALGEPDTIVVEADDSYDYLPQKVVAFFKHALATSDFEWLFKCDDDTYVALDRLSELAIPEYQLIGSEYIDERGSPSGGAGYFLSREIVEKIVGDSTLSQTGPEDVIIGEAAIRLGAKALGTGRLRMSAIPYPRPDNKTVSAHWCSPDRLKAIHAIYTTRPIHETHLNHAHWSDKIRYYEGGYFARNSTPCCGKWSIDGNGTRILKWYDWPDEIRIPIASPPSQEERLFDAVHTHWCDLVALQPDGTFNRASTPCSGNWVESNGTLELKWHQWPGDALQAESDGGYRSRDLLLKPVSGHQFHLSQIEPSSEDLGAYGEWFGANPEEHCFDRSLAEAIARFLARHQCRSVLDCGCGQGLYVSRLRAAGFRATGVDGNPSTAALSKGTCQVCNLALPAALTPHDATLCLEVGEHVPADYEEAFLDNICSATGSIMILSWAVPGQGGRGHRNVKANSDVEAELESRGFERWNFAEEWLRAQAGIQWFKQSLMVFRRSRPGSLEQRKGTLIAIPSKRGDHEHRRTTRNSLKVAPGTDIEICFFLGGGGPSIPDEADTIVIDVRNEAAERQISESFFEAAATFSDFQQLLIYDEPTRHSAGPLNRITRFLNLQRDDHEGTQFSEWFSINLSSHLFPRDEVLSRIEANNQSSSIFKRRPQRITIELVGGMGNQMFQYAHGLALSRRLGIPLGVGFTYMGRPYSLGVFGIAVDPPSNLPSQHFRAGGPFHPGLEWPTIPMILSSDADDIHIGGYFQNEDYFLPVADEIRQKFALPPNRPAICAGRTAVAVHVRRGDFLKSSLHEICNPAYYQRAMEMMRTMVPDPIFVMISDDPEWCRQTFPWTEDLSICDSQPEEEAMATFLGCDAFILSNSTFGWWGAWLANGQPVIAPDRFLNGKEWPICPQRWITIPTDDLLQSRVPDNETLSTGIRRLTRARPANAPKKGEINLGLLFLTYADVNHPEIWNDFLQASEGRTRVLAHPKQPEKIHSDWLREGVITDHHETAWGDVSLVRAMLSLMKEAYRDPNLSHFAFLSESCIPVKSWSYISSYLRSDPRSMLESATQDSMNGYHLERWHGSLGIPKEHWRVHPQWALLNRSAVACLLQSDQTHAFKNVFAADEHYWGTILANRGFPEAELNLQPSTWVQWANHSPTSIPKVDIGHIEQLRNFQGFFARKFPPDSDIGEWALHTESLISA